MPVQVAHPGQQSKPFLQSEMPAHSPPPPTHTHIVTVKVGLGLLPEVGHASREM